MNEWVWSNGGMILTGENWSTEGKTLYSVSGRWMNEWSSGEIILTGENWNAGTRTLYSLGGKWMTEWSNGGMIVTGENWSAEGKTLYSVSGRWMTEWSSGGMILTGETEVQKEKHYTAWVVGGWMSGAVVEWYWQGKLKYRRKNIIQRGW